MKGPKARSMAAYSADFTKSNALIIQNLSSPVAGLRVGFMKCG
jgi:hypothetical protein